MLEEPRRGGRRGAARLFSISAQPEAAGAGHDNDHAAPIATSPWNGANAPGGLFPLRTTHSWYTPEVRPSHHDYPCPKLFRHSTPSASIRPPLPRIRKKAKRCAVAAPVAPTSRPATLLQPAPAPSPRARRRCQAYPVARSGLPPHEQNTCPPRGLVQPGIAAWLRTLLIPQLFGFIFTMFSMSFDRPE